MPIPPEERLAEIQESSRPTVEKLRERPGHLKWPALYNNMLVALTLQPVKAPESVIKNCRCRRTPYVASLIWNNISHFYVGCRDLVALCGHSLNVQLISTNYLNFTINVGTNIYLSYSLSGGQLETVYWIIT